MNLLRALLALPILLLSLLLSLAHMAICRGCRSGGLCLEARDHYQAARRALARSNGGSL